MGRAAVYYAVCLLVVANVGLDSHAGLAVITHNWVKHGSIFRSQPIREHVESRWRILCLSPRNDLLLQKHCHIEALR